MLAPLISPQALIDILKWLVCSDMGWIWAKEQIQLMSIDLSIWKAKPQFCWGNLNFILMFAAKSLIHWVNVFGMWRDFLSSLSILCAFSSVNSTVFISFSTTVCIFPGTIALPYTMFQWPFCVYSEKLIIFIFRELICTFEYSISFSLNSEWPISRWLCNLADTATTNSKMFYCLRHGKLLVPISPKEW